MNYKVYNDYELIYMIRENDDYSRDILYQKYNPIIRKIASDYYSRFSNYGYDYDDFVQEAYILFQKSLKYYNEKKSCLFYTFVIMCIKRGLSSFCHRISSNNKSVSMSNYVDIDDLPIMDMNVNLDDCIIQDEFEKKLKKLLFDLPFEISNVFELRINSFSYSEISSLLDIPLSTVNFRCKKVRDAIRHLFDNYYGEKII